MKPEVLATIYAETVARRKLPVNFNEDHRALFEGELERVIAETRLLKFEDVWASRANASRRYPVPTPELGTNVPSAARTGISRV